MFRRTWRLQLSDKLSDKICSCRSEAWSFSSACQITKILWELSSFSAESTFPVLLCLNVTCKLQKKVKKRKEKPKVEYIDAPQMKEILFIKVKSFSHDLVYDATSDWLVLALLKLRWFSEFLFPPFGVLGSALASPWSATPSLGMQFITLLMRLLRKLLLRKL